MRRLGTLLASLALAGLGSVLAPSTAHAQEVSCPPHFLDLTTDSVLDEAVVTDASLQLSRLSNGDVYVLGFQTEPQGDLGVYLDQLYMSCPKMGNSDGLIRGNMAVLAFVLEPEIDAILDVGDSYRNALNESELDAINDDYFWAGFDNGDPTAAVVDAQNALADKFRTSAAESPAKPSAEAKAAGSVLKWMIISLLGGATLITFVIWVIGRRQRRLDAQAEAKEVAEQASSKIGALTNDGMKSAYVLLTAQVGAESLALLQQQYNAANQMYKAALDADAAWNDRSIELDPERRLSLADYQTVINMNATTVSLATEAADAIGKFEARCNKLLEQIKTAPEALKKLKDRLEKLKKDDDKLGDHDAKMVLQAKFSTVQNGLDVAKGLIDEGKTGEAVMVLEKADGLLDEIATSHDEIREEIDRRKASEDARQRGDVFGRSNYQPPSGDYNRPAQPAPAPQPQRQRQQSKPARRRQRQNPGGGSGLPSWPGGGGSKPRRKSGGGGGGGGFSLPRPSRSSSPKPSRSSGGGMRSRISRPSSGGMRSRRRGK